MPIIHIGFNTTINPCVLTTKGEFAPDTHAIYICCQSNTNRKFYDKYGWYLGTVWLGHPNLGTIERSKLSKIMTEISQVVDSVVEGSHDDLYDIMIERLKKISEEMSARLPQDCSPITITKYNYTGKTLDNIKTRLEPT